MNFYNILFISLLLVGESLSKEDLHQEGEERKKTTARRNGIPVYGLCSLEDLLQRSGERNTDYDYQATWTRPSGLSSLTVGSTSSSFFSDNYLPLHDARIAGNTIGRYLLRLAVNMMKIWDSFIGPNKESYY